MRQLPLEEYAALFADDSRPTGEFSLALAERGDTPLPRRSIRGHKYTFGRALLAAKGADRVTSDFPLKLTREVEVE